MVLIKDMPPAHLCSQTALYHDMCKGQHIPGQSLRCTLFGSSTLCHVLSKQIDLLWGSKKEPYISFLRLCLIFFFFFFPVQQISKTPVFVAIQALPTHSLSLEPWGCATTTALNHTWNQKGLMAARPRLVHLGVTAAGAAPLGLLQGRKTSKTQRQLRMDEFSHPHGYMLLCFYPNWRMCFREKFSLC